ncbi:TlpA disulfide reductase family protein [Granulicella sp. L46]|uniref:TlpA disulfide reductase family protein n=1 Tax=Granulicella sp. L46 TaxID=1641865 RepID=UPI0027389978|nr:TlpA disulfide reductase family protein [Granulicella sp. L46]
MQANRAALYLEASQKDIHVKRSGLVVGLMIAGISLMFWVGWHNLRARRLAMQQAEANRIVLTPAPASSGTAQASPSDTDPAEVLMRGKKAPAFTLTTIDGKKVSLSDYKGRPVLVNFWATWCGACKLEMPWFEEFQQKYGSQGFEILGIAQDDAAKDEIDKVAKRINVSYPILFPDAKVAPAYGGVEYLPESFYVGRDGIIQIQTAGLASDGLGAKDEIEANIKRLIAGGATALPSSGAATAALIPLN